MPEMQGKPPSLPQVVRQKDSRTLLLRFAALSLLITLLILFTGCSSSQNGNGSDEGRYAVENPTSQELKDYTQARSSGMPLWLLFSSDTCPTCDQLKVSYRELEPEYSGKVTFITVNVDDPANADFVQAWDIKYVPTSFLLNSRGEVNFEQVGLIDRETLTAELDQVVK